MDHTTGRQQRGSLVAGLTLGKLRTRARTSSAWRCACPPVVARAVLGVGPADLDRTVIARRCETGPSVAPEAARVWDRIVVSRGRVRIGELALQVGWSRKHLWSRFRSQIGLSPKRAAELVRFNHAAHPLATGTSAARGAAEGGTPASPTSIER